MNKSESNSYSLVLSNPQHITRLIALLPILNKKIKDVNSLKEKWENNQND